MHEMHYRWKDYRYVVYRFSHSVAHSLTHSVTHSVVERRQNAKKKKERLHTKDSIQDESDRKRSLNTTFCIKESSSCFLTTGMKGDSKIAMLLPKVAIQRRRWQETMLFKAMLFTTTLFKAMLFTTTLFKLCSSRLCSQRKQSDNQLEQKACIIQLEQSKHYMENMPLQKDCNDDDGIFHSSLIFQAVMASSTQKRYRVFRILFFPCLLTKLLKFSPSRQICPPAENNDSHDDVHVKGWDKGYV